MAICFKGHCLAALANTWKCSHDKVKLHHDLQSSIRFDVICCVTICVISNTRVYSYCTHFFPRYTSIVPWYHTHQYVCFRNCCQFSTRSGRGSSPPINAQRRESGAILLPAARATWASALTPHITSSDNMAFSSRRAVAALLLLALVAWCVDARPASADGHKKALQKQQKNLQKMKCVPKHQKFDVKSLLEADNDLIDKQLLTNVVAIKRCDDSCAYCGTPGGYEEKKCKPVKSKKKKFAVIYLGEKGQREQTYFKAEEHKRCSCQWGWAGELAHGCGSYLVCIYLPPCQVIFRRIYVPVNNIPQERHDTGTAIYQRQPKKWNVCCLSHIFVTCPVRLFCVCIFRYYI